MKQQISYEILEQMIQCFGKCFHYKDSMASFMRSSDVPKIVIDKYRDLPKFVWARKVLEELSVNENDLIIQRKLLTNLCKLRDLPDSGVLDRNAGLDSLRKLKRLAYENDYLVKEEDNKNIIQKRIIEEKQALIMERAKKLEELREIFNNNLMTNNRQKAGYILEDLLKELFEINNIEYRKSFRTIENTQQIDGYFKFDSFDYLVEAKWRKDYPNGAEIAGFQHKINSKIESTRGLFVSINGFREEVINEFRGKGSNIIFMDGQDLILILEGRVNLDDCLRFKIERAVQIGETYSPLILSSIY
ncbi:restriction endonuclease [Lysinibacillus boronitolerans]|uniref:Restriction endonuclease n=1 Tax=Lysinibacillus boronitolerans JCM 21713 = 10a = NBRC 103108 TaxID=1294264 RepID=A0ABR4Y5K9_9BACI|nr:restriction endonuclease [Lysinibacillus boronitolerans]KGR89362.1 restriction endonuclease [Lysinibacillus boronitolerans JCM 21713 = 10a = NBRC 103108]